MCPVCFYLYRVRCQARHGDQHGHQDPLLQPVRQRPLRREQHAYLPGEVLGLWIPPPRSTWHPRVLFLLVLHDKIRNGSHRYQSGNVPVISPILGGNHHRERKYRKTFKFRGCILIIPVQAYSSISLRNTKEPLSCHLRVLRNLARELEPPEKNQSNPGVHSSVYGGVYYQGTGKIESPQTVRRRNSYGVHHR